MGTIREIPISQPSSDDGPKDLHDYFTIEKKKFRYLPGVRSSLNCPGCAGGVTKRWLHLCDGIVIPLCLWCAWRLNEIEPLYIDFLEQLKKRIDCKTPILYDAENKLIITFNTNEKASSSFNKASITDCAPNHTNETSANQDPNTSVSSLLPATQVTSPCQGTSVSPYRPAIPSYLSVFQRISREVDNSTAIQNSELANNLNKREFYGNVDALDGIGDRMETEEADVRAHEMIERSDSYIYSDFDDCRFKYHEEEVTPTVCVGCCYGKKKTKRYLILTGSCLVAFCTWCTWCLNYKYSEYISELLRIVEEKYEKPIFLDEMNQRITYAAIREKGRTMYRSYNRIKNLQRSESSRLEDELNDNHENDIENLTDGSNSAETDSDEEDDDEGGFKPFYLY